MNSIIIEIPEGYRLDKISSNSEKIILEPIKNLDIYRELFKIFYNKAKRTENFIIKVC